MAALPNEPGERDRIRSTISGPAVAVPHRQAVDENKNARQMAAVEGE
jgi:hypothetical protein